MFRSKFVEPRIFKDLTYVLRYKLRIYGFRLEVPGYVFCDNRGFVNNMNITESVIHKKYNAINYHSVCEAVAADILRIGKGVGKTNLAVLLTKVVTGQK